VYKEQECKSFACIFLMLKLSQAAKSDVTQCKPLVWWKLMTKFDAKMY